LIQLIVYFSKCSSATGLPVQIPTFPCYSLPALGDDLAGMPAGCGSCWYRLERRGFYGVFESCIL